MRAILYSSMQNTTTAVDENCRQIDNLLIIYLPLTKNNNNDVVVIIIVYLNFKH